MGATRTVQSDIWLTGKVLKNLQTSFAVFQLNPVVVLIFV